MRFLLAAALLVLAACSPAAQTGKPVVAVSHYPVEYLVREIAGDTVDVVSLASPGTEPHDIELSPQQVGQVQTAAALFYIGGFQPSVDDAVSEADGEVVDLAQGLPLRPQDPHVWLDPILMEDMAASVADTLTQIDPAKGEQYAKNAEQLRSTLQALDKDWRAGTKTCDIRTMVVSHEAFGYLADRYGFVQRGIAGLSPESEPSAAAVAELASFVQDSGVTTVYTESLVDPAVAQTVASEAGARTATLDPLETQPADGDYESAMHANLATVRTVQGCT